jgi:hypothetical protein
LIRSDGGVSAFPKAVAGKVQGIEAAAPTVMVRCRAVLRDIFSFDVVMVILTNPGLDQGVSVVESPGERLACFDLILLFSRGGFLSDSNTDPRGMRQEVPV